MPHQPKVLIIENDPNTRSAFEEFFRKEGCAVIDASNAAEALKILGRQSLQMIVMEVERKGQPEDGSYRRIKRLHPNLPLIVITGDPQVLPGSDRDGSEAD